MITYNQLDIQWNLLTSNDFQSRKLHLKVLSADIHHFFTPQYIQQKSTHDNNSIHYAPAVYCIEVPWTCRLAFHGVDHFNKLFIQYCTFCLQIIHNYHCHHIIYLSPALGARYFPVEVTVVACFIESWKKYVGDCLYFHNIPNCMKEITWLSYV